MNSEIISIRSQLFYMNETESTLIISNAANGILKKQAKYFEVSEGDILSAILDNESLVENVVTKLQEESYNIPKAKRIARQKLITSRTNLKWRSSWPENKNHVDKHVFLDIVIRESGRMLDQRHKQLEKSLNIITHLNDLVKENKKNIAVLLPEENDIHRDMDEISEILFNLDGFIFDMLHLQG